VTLIPGLTRPENFVERPQRRRIAAKIAQAGGCAMCLNRDRTCLVFGRAVCISNHSRAYPLCLKDGKAPAFELDEQQLKDFP
jgi:hypothetical protein